jgi:hypothetical protein
MKQPPRSPVLRWLIILSPIFLVLIGYGVYSAVIHANASSTAPSELPASQTTLPFANETGANETNQTMNETTNQTLEVPVAEETLANETALPQFIARINAGGPQYIDQAGQTWDADRNYVNGSVFEVFEPIVGTEDDALYQSERWGADGFQYQFPVDNGTYQVTLYFAELYFETSGMRRFDVTVENQTVITDLDIFVEAGAFTAAARTFNASVADGVLNIRFIPGAVENPKVNAISVVRIG